MFEITLSTAKQKSKTISLIMAKLRPSFKQMKGIMACEEYDDRVRLALAVQKDKKDMALFYIFDAISEAIILDNKEDFFKQNLKVCSANKLSLGVFIKVLVLFDKASDKEIIKKALVPSGEIALDSLYYFRLWELEKKWKDLCKIVDDNAFFLKGEGTLLEMMKFIVATSEIAESEVHIHNKEGLIFAHNKEGKELFNCLYDDKDDNCKICVLGELLSLSPSKIVVHRDIADQELSGYITSLFDGRVRVLK